MNWYSDSASDHPDFSEEAERAVWARRSYSTGRIGAGRMTDNDDRRINASNRSPEGRGRVKWHLALLPDDAFEIVPVSLQNPPCDVIYRSIWTGCFWL